MRHFRKLSHLLYVICICLLCTHVLHASSVRGPQSQFDFEFQAVNGLAKNTAITLEYTIKPNELFKGGKPDNGTLEISVVEYKNRGNVVFTDLLDVNFESDNTYTSSFTFTAPSVDVLELKFILKSDNGSGIDYQYLVFADNGTEILSSRDFMNSPHISHQDEYEHVQVAEVKPYQKSPNELTREELQKEYYFGFKINTASERDAVEKIIGDLSTALHFDKNHNVYTVFVTLESILKIKDIVPDCEISEKKPPGLKDLIKNR